MRPELKVALKVDPLHPETTFNSGLIHWRSAHITDQTLLNKLWEVRTVITDFARVDYLTGLVQMERADAQAAVALLTKAAKESGHRAGIASGSPLALSLSIQPLFLDPSAV